jgi:hypothetical protein
MTLVRRKLTRLSLLAALFVALLAPAPASAQPPPVVKHPPYDVQGLEHKRLVIPWISAFCFVALAVAVGLKNPQRSTTGRT